MPLKKAAVGEHGNTLPVCLVTRSMRNLKSWEKVRELGGHEETRGSWVWASLSKARGGPKEGPSSRRLFHYLRRPVQIPNIPAVILTIAALASASHCQAPQRARRRHGPKLLLCACVLPEQEGGPAQARDL